MVPDAYDMFIAGRKALAQFRTLQGFRLNPSEARLLYYLAMQHYPVKGKSILRGEGFNLHLLYAAIRRFIAHDLIERTPDARYVITINGRAVRQQIAVLIRDIAIARLQQSA